VGADALGGYSGRHGSMNWGATTLRDRAINLFGCHLDVYQKNPPSKRFP
jgi:hypothetical protein